MQYLRSNISMQFINPDDEKELTNFYRNWKSHYPDSTKTVNKKKITTEGIKPPSIVTMRILFQYATDGSIPGENIVAMLQNDLYATFNTSPADEVGLIPSTLQYITTYLPTESWGNPEKYGKWINNKRRSKIGKPTDYY